MRYFRREKEVKFCNVQKCPPIGGRCWHTGCPLSTPLGSNVVFQQVGLRAAFCEPRPRLSLIEMLWGCIGKVANPLPKPLGPVVLSNGTQKRKLFRCGSEVIRSFPHFHPFFSKKRHARPLPAKHGHLSKKLLLQTPLFKTILCKLGMWGHPYSKIFCASTPSNLFKSVLGICPHHKIKHPFKSV